MMNRKNILFVNQSSGYLMLDIVNAFVRSKKYDKVELFTGKINIRPTKPNKKIRIIKTIENNKKNFLTRFISWLIATLHLAVLVLLKSNSYELFLVSNPPLSIFVSLLTKKKYTILIYDLYPDTIVSQKLLKKDSIIIKVWSKVNRKVFNHAQKVITISEDMKKVISQYVNSNNIEVISNWAHNDHLKPVKKEDNIFLKKYNLLDQLVVLYSGNMGLSHSIDVMVDVALRLKQNSKIKFVFIGEGAKKAKIISKIANLHLDNCLVLPFQDLATLPYSLGAADVSVITTDSQQSGLSVPSKTYSCLAVGSALLCIADKVSEIGRMTTTYCVGKCFNKADVNSIVNYIMELFNDSDKLEKYKRESRRLSFKYSPKNAYKYVEILNEY